LRVPPRSAPSQPSSPASAADADRRARQRYLLRKLGALALALLGLHGQDGRLQEFVERQRSEG
jgi:hypothetical protein